jgi:hypothetical protein
MLGASAVVLRSSDAVAQLQEPVSLWPLDSNAQDAQPTNNHGALAGAPELGLLPLENAGESIGLDGVDDAVVIAHHSAYETPAWAWHLKIQPDTTPVTGNRVFLGKGTFIGNGEISIEQRTNGLNAYTTQGGTVFWQGPGGSADGVVPLTPGVACDVIFQGGPAGTELWHRPAGGSWALVGSSAATSGLAANTGSIYLGRSPYGGAWFDGLVDNLAFFRRKLDADDRALIPPPISRAHQPEAELRVPTIEFLTSDEPNPGTITKYVSNQNRGNGSGSSPANAQEVQAALNGASPGHTFLAVCQTPGTIEYWEKTGGLSIPSGTPGNPVTLQARQGDGVVISRDEQFAGARTPNSGFWTQSGLSQADIDKKIWRSTATFTTGATVRLYGMWIEFSHPHHLVAYSNLTDLQAAYGTADTPTNYGIPGAVLHTDGRVYIRMQKPHPGKYSVSNTWKTYLWPGHPEAISNGQLAYPVSENPNSYPIHLYRRSGGGAFVPTTTSGHVKIGSGINSLGYMHTVRENCSNITMRRGTHICWHSFVRISGATTTQNYDLQRARMSCGSKRHGSRDEWKFGGFFEGDRGAWVEQAGGNPSSLNTMQNWMLKDCTIADFHEIIVGQGQQWRFRNCVIFNIIDDGIQGSCGTNQVEFGYCYFRQSAIGGHSDQNATGGQYYFHHNVIDARGQKCAFYRQAAVPGFLWLNHSTAGSQPRKNYNNTIIYSPDVEEAQPSCLAHNPDRNNTSAEPHEVFNNIVIRHDIGRYPQIGFFGLPRTDNAQSFVYYGGVSNERWDYNLYYRDVPTVGGPHNGFLDGLFQVRAQLNATIENYLTLAAWRASAGFNTSKGIYAPGFEANGTDTKPTLPSLDNFPTDRFKYRPSATSAVTTATTSSLSGVNWWSTPPTWGSAFPWNDGEKTLAPSPWKGALDPNGTTMPVGVQDP